MKQVKRATISMVKVPSWVKSTYAEGLKWEILQIEHAGCEKYAQASRVVFICIRRASASSAILDAPSGDAARVIRFMIEYPVEESLEGNRPARLIL